MDKKTKAEHDSFLMAKRMEYGLKLLRWIDKIDNLLNIMIFALFSIICLWTGYTIGKAF